MKNTKFCLYSLGLLFCSWQSLSAQLIFEYRFNETGTTAVSIGSNTSSLNLFNSSNAAADLHSASGTGVSGQVGDRAFDNSASTGMGSAGTGGRGQVSAPTSPLSSFTLQGWFKTDGSVAGNGARLIDSWNGTNGFFLSASGGQFSLQVNGNNVFTSSAAYNAVSTWTYFAVTYDGTLTSNNVNFYIGGLNTAVSLVQTRTVNSGSTSIPAALTIGDVNGGTIRPFDGLMDDVRVFGASSGQGGVLGQSQLEALRIADIPEPSSVALLTASGLFTGIWLLRRKRIR